MAQETRVRVAKRTIDEDAEQVVFTFGNGQTLVCGLSEVKSLKTRLALHGLAQKVGDAFASAKGNIDLAIGWAQDVWNVLKTGEWSERRGESEDTPSLVQQAVAVVFGKDLDKVRAAWSKLPEATIKAFKSDVKIKAEVARMRAERASTRAAAVESTINADELFG